MASHPHLLPPTTLTHLISSYLHEDCPSFDYGGHVVGPSPSTAHLYQKSPGVLAGVPFFNEVFRQLGCSVEWHVKEGTDAWGTADQTSKKKVHIATIHGPTPPLLLAERVALNTLSRASGIASVTRRLLSLLRSQGYKNTLAGTRKTTPGFRLVEKYAIVVGGGDTHRMDLSGMVMLKDNHVVACRNRNPRSVSGSERGGGAVGGGAGVPGQGEVKEDDEGSIKTAVAAARSAAGFSLKIEVECSSESQAVEAIEAGADVIMLDNFAPSEWGGVSRRLKERFGRGRFLIEVSGGLTEGNLLREEGVEEGGGGEGGGGGYLTDDIDVVSTSSIHQGVPHVDFSLKIVEGNAAAV